MITMHEVAREDVQLVEEALGGNQLSFQLLIERYQERIFGLARHYTKSAVEVEDIVQDTFLKAYRRLESFQRQSSFSTWLYRIAVNTALDFLKRMGRSPVQAVEDPELSAAPVRAQAGSGVSIAGPDARLRREEIGRITTEVLDELPEIFRTVLVLREFEDLSYQQMADVLGVSIGTVESRLFRARARFKEAMIRLHPEFAAGDA
jgi:RNA polymerase sigma-70 factor (ECF subfamily)